MSELSATMLDPYSPLIYINGLPVQVRRNREGVWVPKFPKAKKFE